MQLFNALGIDWKILIAQLVNFTLLLWILYKFGYKPILKFVDERTNKIKKGVKDAEYAAQTLENATIEHKKIVSNAHKEAQRILAKANAQSTAQAQEIIEAGKKEAARIIDAAQDTLAEQQQRLIRDAREEIADLVIRSVEKVLEEKLDDATDRKLIEKMLTKQ